MVNEARDYKVYALKIAERSQDVFASLQKGEGRFGWSYVETADLHSLRSRINQEGWASLSADEQSCYQRFLLDLEPGDWVIFVNTPAWGQCAMAQVTGGYYWRWDDKDFNHRFAVDPETVRVFNRNDAVVHPALSTRLKLQGRQWRIYTKREFEELRQALQEGRGGRPLTPDGNLQFLSDEVTPLLEEITARIQRTHPKHALEWLLERIYKKVPGVVGVKRQGGRADHGADILVTFEERHPLTNQVSQKTYLVQVKSFEGDHWDTQAVEDIRRAFGEYPEANAGLIVSTARRTTPRLENELDRLREESGKPVSLLIGRDIALFVLRYADEILPRGV